MLKNVCRALCVCVVIGVFATVAPCVMAQTASTGALVGRVMDSTGAVVPNAMVTATSRDTGQVRVVTTSSDGTYKFSLLPPGNYQIKFAAPGFSTAEIASATVNVTETAVLDRELQVGGQSQEVIVQADVETIQTASSALGTVVTTQTITELPLNTRNYTNLLTMSSGANGNVTNAASVGKGATLILVNGGATAQNTYLQDGVSINNWYSLGTGTEGTLYGSFAVPNPDAIAEFKIQTSSYDAGYGRNPGANVNVVTKSGTNSFHGTGFEFFRNTTLNANDWFRNSTGGSKLVDNQNQYGGVFGGPVKKDKLFFFVSYQETGQKNGITGYGFSSVNLPAIPAISRGTCPAGWTVLSQCDAAAQAFVPAFAAAICPAGNPNAPGDKSKTATQVLCAPTAGAPLANINPVAISILQLKLANGGYMISGSGGAANAPYPLQTFTDPAIFKDHQGIGNFDYVINSKETLSGRYDYEQDPLTGNFAVTNATVQANAFPGSPISTIKTDHNAILRLTSILSNSFVNEARVSYQRYVTLNTELGQFKNSQVGVTDLTPGIDYLTYFTVNGVGSFGAHYFFGAYAPENQFELGDQISWTHRKHTIRAGFEQERVQADQTYPSLSSGNPVFNSFGDFLVGQGGNLLSVGTSSARNSTFPYALRVNEFSAFGQDDFKVSSRLTLNLGVRWEYDGYPTEKFGNMSNIWPTLVNAVPKPGTSPATGTLAGFVVPSNYTGSTPAGIFRNTIQNTTIAGAPKDDFAPRVGFAWQPTSSDRLVIRAGTGYFYDLIAGQAIGNPLTLTNPGVGSPASGGSALATATLADPWVLPQTVGAVPGEFGFTPRWVNPANNTSSNISMGILQQNLTVPLTYEWNLNTEWEFRPSWVMEVGYVGSHGIHQAATPLVGTAGGSAQAGSIPYNLAQLAGGPCNSCALNGITTNTAANSVLRVPYLGLSATGGEFADQESYKYNSLQATLRKQLSHGFQFQAAYTWSRGFTTFPIGVNSYPYLIQEYGLNPSYHPQRLVVNYIWNLPLGHAQGIEGKILEGWSLSGVTTVQNGTPMSITDSTGGAIFCGGTSCGGFATISPAQFCPGMSNGNIATSGSVEQRVGAYLNGKTGVTGSVFCNVPTVGAIGGVGGGTGFGTAGLGIVRGPSQNNWDMSLAKLISVREGQTLQFRSEFFNTYNHPQFNNPTSLNVASSNFGQITSTSVSPRVIQFALKYSF